MRVEKTRAEKKFCDTDHTLFLALQNVKTEEHVKFPATVASTTVIVLTGYPWSYQTVAATNQSALYPFMFWMCAYFNQHFHRKKKQHYSNKCHTDNLIYVMLAIYGEFTIECVISLGAEAHLFVVRVCSGITLSFSWGSSRTGGSDSRDTFPVPSSWKLLRLMSWNSGPCLTTRPWATALFRATLSCWWKRPGPMEPLPDKKAATSAWHLRKRSTFFRLEPSGSWSPSNARLISLFQSRPGFFPEWEWELPPPPPPLPLQPPVLPPPLPPPPELPALLGLGRAKRPGLSGSL